MEEKRDRVREMDNNPEIVLCAHEEQSGSIAVIYDLMTSLSVILLYTMSDDVHHNATYVINRYI
eukprot:12114141-Ditylum_brightwellii.AAC.1